MFQQFACGNPPHGDDVYPLSAVVRHVEDILFERGIEICHETMRFWWDRFGPMFAAQSVAIDESLDWIDVETVMAQ